MGGVSPAAPAVGASHRVQEAGSVGRREASTGLAGPGLVEDSGPQGREGLKDTPILVWGDMSVEPECWCLEDGL